MSTITDLTPVLKTANPSFSGSGSMSDQKDNSTQTSTNSQTTGGAGSVLQSAQTQARIMVEQAQSGARIFASERSSKTVGLSPSNADAESVVLSKAFQSEDALGGAMDAAVSEARRLNEAAMDRLRIDQLISGLTEARQAFEQELKTASDMDFGSGDPMAMISPAEEGEAIRLGGSTY